MKRVSLQGAVSNPNDVDEDMAVLQKPINEQLGSRDASEKVATKLKFLCRNTAATGAG